MTPRIGPFPSITVFGGATMDRIAAAAAPPALGVSNPGSARRMAGGVGLNVAAALARLGHPVRLVSRVGSDADGDAIIAAARGAGVDTSFVGVSQRSPSAAYHAVLDDVGGLVIGIAAMAICDEITAAAVAPATQQSSPDELWVIDANLPAETLAFLVGEAASSGRAVAALAVSPAKAVRLGTLVDRLTLLFANRREAAAILGIADGDRQPAATELAAAFGGAKASNVVITNSTDAVVVASGGEVRSFVPLKARVKSVNGAGDALAAGTLHGIASGRNLFEAVMSGLAAAAIAVESEATILSDVTPGGLAERIGTGTPAP